MKPLIFLPVVPRSQKEVKIGMEEEINFEISQLNIPTPSVVAFAFQLFSGFAVRHLNIGQTNHDSGHGHIPEGKAITNEPISSHFRFDKDSRRCGRFNPSYREQTIAIATIGATSVSCPGKSQAPSFQNYSNRNPDLQIKFKRTYREQPRIIRQCTLIVGFSFWKTK